MISGWLITSSPQLRPEAHSSASSAAQRRVVSFLSVPWCAVLCRGEFHVIPEVPSWFSLAHHQLRSAQRTPALAQQRSVVQCRAGACPTLAMPLSAVLLCGAVPVPCCVLFAVLFLNGSIIRSVIPPALLLYAPGATCSITTKMLSQLSSAQI